MIAWKKFDLNNKSFPKEPGLYIWKTGKLMGVFEVLSHKPGYVPYDMRYYISQNKLVYIVFDEAYPPRDEKNQYIIEEWVQQ